MRRPQVKLDNLIAVIEVAEKRDFERAAKELGLTPSAVRKQVETLEGILGVPLFDGKKGRLSLTDDGKLFHADAARSVEYALLAEEKVQARLALRNRRLFIGHSTYLPPQLIALITRLEVDDSSSAFDIQHVSGLTSTTAKRVAEGSLHAGVGFLPVQEPSLIVRDLFEEPLVVCIPSGHKLALKAVIYPQDLTDEPVIAVSREPLPYLHREIEEHFNGFGITLKIVADAFAPPEALTLVAQKLGICFLAGSSAVTRPGVMIRPMSTKFLKRRSGIFVREDNHSPLLQRLIDTLLKRVKEFRLKG